MIGHARRSAARAEEYFSQLCKRKFAVRVSAMKVKGAFQHLYPLWFDGSCP